MQKIRAYTILELTVAMLLASISITIAYTALDIIGRSHQKFNAKNGQIVELITADKLLKRDFSGNGLISQTDENSITFLTDSGLINYHFNDKYLLRNQYGIRTDTIRVEIEDVIFSYEGEAAETDGPIDFIQISLKADDQIFNRSYRKIYSSDDLFQGYTNGITNLEKIPDN